MKTTSTQLSSKTLEYLHRLRTTPNHRLSPLDIYVKQHLPDIPSEKEINRLKQEYRNLHGDIYEHITAKVLDDYGIRYTRDSKIKGKKLPDFILPDFRTTLECKNTAPYYQLPRQQAKRYYLDKFEDQQDKTNIIIASYLNVSRKLRKQIQNKTDVLEFCHMILGRAVYLQLTPNSRKGYLPDTPQSRNRLYNFILRGLKLHGIILLFNGLSRSRSFLHSVRSTQHMFSSYSGTLSCVPYGFLGILAPFLRVFQALGLGFIDVSACDLDQVRGDGGTWFYPLMRGVRNGW